MEKKLFKAATDFGVKDRLKIFKNRDLNLLSQSDIITNSGHVRPIDRQLLDVLKKSAVLPLMWETWELRESDFDINLCKEKQILVLGTEEHEEPNDMTMYNGWIGLKILFELGFDGGDVLIIGSPRNLTKPMQAMMKDIGCEVTLIGNFDDADLSYAQFENSWKKISNSVDIIIFAHHGENHPFSAQSKLKFHQLANINPTVKIGVITADIEKSELHESGLTYFPERLASKWFMSYSAAELGYRPVIDLFAAGLKVGQEMMTGRQLFSNLEDAANYTLANSPAMDLQGHLAWVKE